MKSIIYAFLFLTLPISMAGKDTTTTKTNNPALMQAAKQEEIKIPPAPSIVKHDTVYVAIQEESYSLIVDIVASFFTLVAIIASILYSIKAIRISEATLKEMKEQRLAAYRPEINIKMRNSFFIQIDLKISDEPIKLGYLDTVSESSNRYLSDKFEIAISNIGLAPLKNLKYKWEIENERVKDIIDFVNKNNNEVSMSYNNGNFFTLLGTKKSMEFIDIERSIDFVLPLKDDTHSEDLIIIPITYMLLYVLYVKIIGCDLGNRDRPVQFPDIKLTISYFDIHNNPYEKIYNLRVYNGRTIEEDKLLVHFNSFVTCIK